MRTAGSCGTGVALCSSAQIGRPSASTSITYCSHGWAVAPKTAV